MCRRMRKLNWRIQHIDVPMTLHDLAITRFSQYWRRSQRAGFAYAAVSSRFRDTAEPFWADEVKPQPHPRPLLAHLTDRRPYRLPSILVRSPWPFASLVPAADRTRRTHRMAISLEARTLDHPDALRPALPSPANPHLLRSTAVHAQPQQGPDGIQRRDPQSHRIQSSRSSTEKR